MECPLPLLANKGANTGKTCREIPVVELLQVEAMLEGHQQGSNVVQTGFAHRSIRLGASSITTIVRTMR